jgi:DNA replicative helicase MCM subunit Mcm2 (Cdc46/Mcm family)
MHLRSEVKKEDVDVAIRVMLRSFVQTQKHSVAKLIEQKFRQYL